MKGIFSKLLVSMVYFGSILQSQAGTHTFIIRNTQDTTDETSLRGAIMAANSRGGYNTIILAKGTYRLSIPGPDEDAARSGDLDITRGRLAIVGVSGAKVIIDAGGSADRVFQILAGAQLILSDVTISGGATAGGESGGGILNAGHLRLQRCVVRSNYTTTGVGGFSTGPGNSGNVGGKGGDGGGIYNAGKLTVNTTTLSGNLTGAGGWGGGGYFVWDNDFWFFYYYAPGGSGGSGGDGAGIYNTGDLTLNTCTVSGNTNGAGGSSQGAGSGGNGGIYSLGSFTIRSCTVAGNSGGEGGFSYSFFNEYYQGLGGNGGIVNATNSSFATLGNSLVALNAVGSGGVFFVIYDPTNSVWTIGGPSPDLSGAFTSEGYNLIGQAYGSFGFVNGVNEDLVGTSAGPLDPLLGPLQVNGGPTLTHALLPGSPAIDQGKSFGRTADQRGSHRPHDFSSIPNPPGGDGSDIGAFELNGSIRSASAMDGRDDSLAGRGHR